MAYIKNIWKNENEEGKIAINKTNLIHIEDGIESIHNSFDTHTAENAVLLPQGGSTANALLLNIVLADKKKGSFRASVNNTGNMTINGKAFKKDATTEIPLNGVKANKVYDFYYDQASDSVFILAKASGNAQPSDVLAPKTFSNDDGEQTGTMNLSQCIPSNIKAGATIAGVNGTHGNLFVGDYEIASSNSSVGITTSFIKLKEIRVNKPGNVRVKWFTDGMNGSRQIQIFVNGVARGVNYNGAAFPSAPTNWSEDISGLQTNDLVQIYATAGLAGTLSNFKLCCDEIGQATPIL